MAWLTTDVLTGDGVVHGAPCIVGAVVIGTDGVNNVTVDLYDNASAASGNRIIPQFVQVAANARYGGIIEDEGVVCKNGAYIAISGSNAEVCVRYKPLGRTET